MLDDATIRRAAALLAAARHVLFVTGAGLSADSGLPTYRGIDGLYDRGETEDGVPIEVALCTGIPTVEINPGESEVSHLVDLAVRAGAAEALTAIWAVAGGAGT